MSDEMRLITATELEKLGVVKRGTAYRMVKAGLLPHYRRGERGGAIAFSVDEVLAALRQPVQTHQARRKNSSC